MTTRTSSKKTPKPKVGSTGIPVSEQQESDEWNGYPTPSVDVNRPKSKEEILWSEYSIQPNLPIRSKVEQLMLLWRLPAGAIASLMDLSLSVVQEEIDALNKEWAELGKPLDEESRQVVRGRMIVELTKLKADLETANAGNPDPRLLTLKLQVIEKLTKLQGLDLDRKNPSIEEESMNPVEDAIDALGEERRAELLARLKKTAPTPTTD